MKNTIKKLITITAALVIGAGAYAKTLSELSGELKLLKDWDTKVAWANANAADIEATFGEVKKLIAANGNAPSAEKGVCGFAYLAGACTFPQATDWELCCLHSGKFIEVKSQSDPTYYAELKSNGWKIGDKQLSTAQKVNMAYTMKDFDFFIENNSPEVFEVMYIDRWVSMWLTKNLLAMSDTAKAKSICNNIVAALIVRDNADEQLKTMQNVGKELTARALDNKIIK